MRREAPLQVVRATKEGGRHLERHPRQTVAAEAQHPADGVGAIEHRGRTFDDLHGVDGELVHLQPMVVAPLLPLVLHAVLRYRHAVEAQAADGGLGKPRADTDGLHSGNTFKALHQAAGKMLLQIGGIHLHGILRARRRLARPRTDGHGLKILHTVGRRRQQHEHQQQITHQAMYILLRLPGNDGPPASCRHTRCRYLLRRQKKMPASSRLLPARCRRSNGRATETLRPDTLGARHMRNGGSKTHRRHEHHQSRHQRQRQIGH